MKKLFNFLLSALAVMCGGAGMAVVGAADIAKNGADTDPQDGTPLEGATPDSPGKGIDQQGTAATGSAITAADLDDRQLDNYVDHYKAHKYPLAYDIGQVAKQISVDTKEPTNFEVGEMILEAPLKEALTNNTDEEFTVKVHNVDSKIFHTGGTILVEGTTGYDPTGSIQDGNPLVLMTVRKGENNGELVCTVLNGYKDGTNNYKKLGKGTVNIPAGTMLYAMAPAMSESEIEIEPDNVLPMEKNCYLQKKVCAITHTELFERIKKKAAWNKQEVKNAVLDSFKRKCTRSMLVGAPTKFVKYNKRTGNEYAYTENGILRQFRLGYQLKDGQLDVSDLIAICSMIFGKYDAGNEITAYCGTKFIQRLLNMNFKDRNEVTVRNYTDSETQIMITSFECNFGKIKFVHEWGLDDLKYSECALLFDPKEAKHFYYTKEKTLSIDHSKGEGGEVREAKTEYYVKDDCVVLGGFNNMIVGPSELISGYKLSALTNMVSVNDLTEVTSPAEGDIAYLIQDTTANKMGLYKYDGSNWKAFDGNDIYV